MNLDALFEPGTLPWSPNGEVSGLDVWNAYDHPLTGTFISGDTAVLFTLLSDFQGLMSLWAYTPVSDAEASGLSEKQFGSVAEVREFTYEYFSGRRLAFALAGEGQIVRWSAPDRRGELLELARGFLNDVLVTGWRPMEAEAELRVKLAQVATGQAELVDA